MDRPLKSFLDKLTARTKLTNEECTAVQSLIGTFEPLKAHSSFARLGDLMTSTILVVDGLCGRVEMPTEERRQITAIYVPGDMPDLYSAFLPEANASMEALTAATIARISHKKIHGIMRAYPALGEAFTRYIVADAAITAEWLINVGSREALASVAHFLCEMAVRLGKVDENRFSFSLPLSQQQFGEVCGLSAVHINRCLMNLRRSRLLQIDKGVVQVVNWTGLKKVGHFTGQYLTPGSPRRFAN